MQEGWRLAVAKRAKEELGSREAALRSQLMQERDHQLQVLPVMLYDPECFDSVLPAGWQVHALTGERQTQKA